MGSASAARTGTNGGLVANEHDPADSGDGGANRWVTVVAVLVALGLVAVLAGVAQHRVSTRFDARRDALQTDVTAVEQGAAPGPTDDVVIVGDSITEMSVGTIQSVLDPTYNVRIRGRGGYRIEEMEPYAIELATSKPEQAIINLGTNDVLTNWPINKSFDALTRMVEDFNTAHCIFLVNLNQSFYNESDSGMGVRALLFNIQLAEFAKSHHAKIIDWSGALAADAAAGSPKGPLTSDTVHPNEEGQKVLAGLYKDALDGCG